MKECPKDSTMYSNASITEPLACPHKIINPTQGSRASPYWCTRPKGHKGKHHCHDNHTCVRAWFSEEEVIEAL